MGGLLRRPCWSRPWCVRAEAALAAACAPRRRALLPATGVAVDLCTGTGAVAAVLGSAHPRATVVATDIDPVAVACARRNGVDARMGDLDAPLSPSLRGRVDVMTAVVPYVPTEELQFLPRDVLANEPRGALDGGPGGTAMLIGWPSQRRTGCVPAAASSWSSAATSSTTWQPSWRASVSPISTDIGTTTGKTGPSKRAGPIPHGSTTNRDRSPFDQVTGTPPTHCPGRPDRWAARPRCSRSCPRAASSATRRTTCSAGDEVLGSRLLPE